MTEESTSKIYALLTKKILQVDRDYWPIEKYQIAVENNFLMEFETQDEFEYAKAALNADCSGYILLEILPLEDAKTILDKAIKKQKDLEKKREEEQRKYDEKQKALAKKREEKKLLKKALEKMTAKQYKAFIQKLEKEVE